MVHTVVLRHFDYCVVRFTSFHDDIVRRAINVLCQYRFGVCWIIPRWLWPDIECSSAWFEMNWAACNLIRVWWGRFAIELHSCLMTSYVWCCCCVTQFIHSRCSAAARTLICDCHLSAADTAQRCVCFSSWKCTRGFRELLNMEVLRYVMGRINLMTYVQNIFQLMRTMHVSANVCL